MIRVSDVTRKAIEAYHKIDETKESVSRSFNRVQRSLDRQESRVMRLIRQNYPDQVVIADGKAHVLIDGALYVMDIVDLDNATCMSEIAGLEYRTVNPSLNPFDLLGIENEHESVISDGAAS